MSPLRMGVMGCANFAWQSMIPALIECDAVDLVAVASRTKDKAQKFSRRFNCDALVGYESLLSRKDIEAIYIPLPTGLHEEWVVKALEARKHLLVEKSFAENFASAKKMTDLACLKKCLVMENFLFPHHSQHNWVTEKIRKFELGQIHLFRSTFGFPPLPSNNFRYDPHLGGGALLDAGAYVVKAAQIFLEGDIELLSAALHYDDKLGVDIYGDAMFTNASGQVAQVSFGFDYYYQCCYEILGTQGKLVVERAFTPPPGYSPWVRLEHPDNVERFELPPDNHYVNMLNFFADAVSTGDDWHIHLDAILQQAKLLDEIRERGLK